MRKIIMVIAATLSVTGAAAQGPAAGQGRPHLQVLNDVPESQLFMVMNAVAASLGVGCEHCHVRNAPNPATSAGGWLWERDDKPAKAMGREMMRMVRELNASRFGGRPVVTCFTCHRGDTRVVNLPPSPPGDAIPTPLTLPAAEDVVARYIAAVGGAGAATRFATLVMKGRDERPQDRYERSEERRGEVTIALKGRDRFRADWRVPPHPARTQAVAASAGWVAQAGGAPRALAAGDVARLRRIAVRYAPLKIVEPVETLRVDRIEPIRGRNTYAVKAVVDANTTHTYFFDISNGLLVRESTTTATPLLPLQEQVDYDDYRSVDGIMLPFLVRTSYDASYDTSTRTFTTIRHDVPLDDALFAMPQQPPPPPVAGERYKAPASSPICPPRP